ncbi:MAG: DivIVA domain-containing protein [Clostridia bacterium]|nr:DivIVA domain-containing protein [Clostridia bacterium]
MLLNAKNIKDAVFATSMSGYKKDEVDALLDKIYEDYRLFEEKLVEKQNKIAELEKELSEKSSSMNSINTVLLSAQKLADEIVEKSKIEAKEVVDAANIEAENIKLRTKKALEEIDSVLTEQRNSAQAQVDIMLEEAARKSEGMILAAKDSVTREQLLFDKLKSEVAEFKHEIKETYKKHLESLSKLPEEVVLNPELAASTIEDIINKEPDLLRFIEKTPVVVPEVVTEESTEEETETAEEETDMDMAKTQVVELPSSLFETSDKEENTSKGFVIETVEDDDAEEDDDDDDNDGPTFSKGFFAKNK